MKIIYEDRELMVVYKEAGLAVETRRPLEKDLESLLKVYLAERDGKAPELYLIHRIDQVVDGLVLFARTKKAAASLTAQLTDGSMEKIYLARVGGRIPAERGELTDWLLKDAKTNTSRIVPPGTRGAKRACLSYERAGEDLLLIRLKTGRHHQIRVQLAGAGMPIKGDVKYGGEADGRISGKGICLTAAELSFKHPGTGNEIRVKVPEITGKGTVKI